MSDPVAVDQVDPSLFASRLIAHLCAPAFVLLTGLSAWLYGQRAQNTRRATSEFLLKRGLFLIFLELTLVNFSWTFDMPAKSISLQVIWAIGVSMVALSALLWMPRKALVIFGLVVIAGHNALDGLHFQAGTPLHYVWAVLHDRSWLDIFGMRVRTSYPVLPWIALMGMGYAMGPWYSSDSDPTRRRKLLVGTAVALMVGFLLLRLFNVYGDRPWSSYQQVPQTVMSFFNVTKYPPSLLFLMLTCSVALLLLDLFENPRVSDVLKPLTQFGGAPMFFYLLHLFVLRALYELAVSIWGTNQGTLFGFDHVWAVWLTASLPALVLYYPTGAFGRLKARRKDWPWLRYL